MEKYDENELKDLYHWGIPGMHWGHHKPKKIVAPSDKDQVGKKVADMSDDELKKLTNRQKLLNDYTQTENNRMQNYLTNVDLKSQVDTKPTSKAKEYMGKLLGQFGDGFANAVKSSTQTYFTQQFKEMLGLGNSSNTKGRNKNKNKTDDANKTDDNKNDVTTNSVESIVEKKKDYVLPSFDGNFTFNPKYINKEIKKTEKHMAKAIKTANKYVKKPENYSRNFSYDDMQKLLTEQSFSTNSTYNTLAKGKPGRPTPSNVFKLPNDYTPMTFSDIVQNARIPVTTPIVNTSPTRESTRNGVFKIVNRKHNNKR